MTKNGQKEMQMTVKYPMETQLPRKKIVVMVKAKKKKKKKEVSHLTTMRKMTM